jgi:hypothetical protein
MFISKNVQNKNCLNLKKFKFKKSSNLKMFKLKKRSNTKKFKFWKFQKKPIGKTKKKVEEKNQQNQMKTGRK